MANKIKYGLDRVYYSKMTATSTGVSYATPVAIPGAVNLTLSKEGDQSVFYADNIKYWVGDNNQGYTGTLEAALLPDSFKKDILGMVADTNSVIYEHQDAQMEHFALLFQFQGDEKAIRHVFYNCVASRPNVEGSTKSESIEPQTETMDLTCSGVEMTVGTAQRMVVKAYADDSADTTVYSGWFSAVYTPEA